MRARHLADGALLAEFPELADPAANEIARALAQALSHGAPGWLLDAIPAARTLLLLFDPDRIGHPAVEDLLATTSPVPSILPSRTVHLPVCYGGAAGPDLEELARALRVGAGELARLHAGAEHRVAFLGFAPGFPYLTGAPRELSLPRLAVPRVRVPARSVAVADGYTGIYPEESPGGWRLIGRVASRMFDPGATPPSLLFPGDRVVFDPIDPAELARLEDLEASSRSPGSLPRAPLLRVVDPGAFTSVQCGPRHGQGALGVGAAGAMDLPSLGAANEAVGNPPFSAALELTVRGPALELLADASFAVAGAPVQMTLDGAVVEGPARGAGGARLASGPIRRGVRAYLAFSGGLAPAPRGAATRPLRRGDVIGRGQGPPPPACAAPRPRPLSFEDQIELRALSGPQWDFFTGAGRETFFSAQYRMTPQSDRRGLRLDGPRVELFRPSDIPPEGTAPGSVQVPGSGLPIVLGPDRPVTGGYAKIATVISADLPLLAQARPGTIIRFRAATLAEALAARRDAR